MISDSFKKDFINASKTYYEVNTDNIYVIKDFHATEITEINGTYFIDGLQFSKVKPIIMNEGKITRYIFCYKEGKVTLTAVK